MTEMDGLVTQLGVGGIFAVILLDRVFAFLSKRKNGNGASASHHGPCHAEELSKQHAEFAREMRRAGQLNERSVRCLEVVIAKCEGMQGTLSDVRREQAVLLDRIGRGT